MYSYNDALKEIKESITKTNIQFCEYESIRIAQNAAISDALNKLSDTMQNLERVYKKQDEKYNALTTGMMELLGDKIDTKYNYYMSLGYIPADEVKTFENLYLAYAANGGNGARAQKYQYIMTNLQAKENVNEL